MRAPPPSEGAGAGALDPAALGLDPSALPAGLDPSALGLDPAALEGAVDPSALGLDPSALAGLDPMAALARADQGALHPMIVEVLRAGAPKVAMAILALAAVFFGARVLRARMRPSERAPGPTWVAAVLILVGLYVFARAVDPLLATTLDRPSWMPEASWPKVGWFEWKLLARPGISLALPLADVPALALILHVPLWLTLLWIVELALRWIYGVGEIGWRTASSALPWPYRWSGSSTARRADQRFRRWIVPLLLVLFALHVVAGLGLGESEVAPAPGTWVVGGLLLWITAYHLLVAGKEPSKTVEDKELGGDDDTDPSAMSDRRDALARLQAAIDESHPGVALDALEERPGRAGERGELPAALAPLVREVFEDLCGVARPWAHQAAVLEHLAGIWTLTASAPAAEDDASLAEVRVRSPIASASAEAPHALVIGGEGSGRTTLTLLAALHVFLDRGATSLVIVRTRAAARAWAARLGDALARSSARWNVQVALAGEDLAGPLLAGRTPAIVVCDLEAFESDVLCDRRTDDLLARLGLVVVDDVDAFHGVAEMHLNLSVRRLWALGATLHAASYPVVLLATAGEGASGVESWARHVLAAPLRVFADDRAPTRARALVRRRDLVDPRGDDLPLAALADAAEAAGIAWHLRLAGDDHRAIRRAEIDRLGGARRHHRDEPAEAALVLIEGTYPAVRREAERLAHAGWRQEEARVVMVLAPPGDEEMILHEEADDAPLRPLVDALPQAVPLSEPRVVRQRHLDRALGREQDLAGLRERLGARFVDDAVEHLAAAGKVRRRQALHIDPRTDAIAEKTLVRADHEVALGQAISAECVTEAAECLEVVDAGTSELLVRVEAAIARAVYPPGRIFLDPRGRYRVLEGDGDPASRTISAERIADASRTTVERQVSVELAEPLELGDRQLGGLRLALALTRARIHEEVVGVRRIGPGPRLLEHRIYEAPITCTYGSDVCMIRGRLEGGVALTPAAAAPLVAALRMMLPCAFRGVGELLDVAALELEGELHLCLFDRTPGASGFAHHLAERSLGDLLTLARHSLARLVGPELGRLWHIHDTSPGADPRGWQIDGALRWLAAILDPPPAEPTRAAPERPRGPRSEHVAGEARGDLGRLWVSRSGRSDDLVWTRHNWWSPLELAGHPVGEVHLDVAVERPLIARARRQADDPEVSATLETIRERVLTLLGERATSAILGLIAAIPLSPRPLAEAERGPLLVLARRRADLPAKHALAQALLPPSVNATPVDVDGGVALAIELGGASQVVELGGPQVRVLGPAAR
ncbi:MAG: hypothetical protein H6710_16940 [Myxococcales bacterium]|nr:hypothetical protein [Myxococcales bacterium]